jgi:AGZA family xanthine/uracil permease-like MFS transporter
VLPSIEPTFLKLDFEGLFTAKAGFIVAAMTIFTLCISDLFDTIGTFIGTGKKSGIFKIDENGNMSKNLERAMISDSLATTVGALFGTSNVTTYVESSAGIEVGGRSGLTAVFAAMCFGLSLFLSPLVACVPMAAISPVLILIGVAMIENIGSINWKDIAIAIPAFFIIIMMPLSYSITTGIQFGFIFYALAGIVTRKGKEISPLIYIFSVLFIITFVYQALA